MVKEYKLNQMFGIRCIMREDGYCRVEVLNISLPFENIIEYVETCDKARANSAFKSLKEKYARCDNILIRG